MTATFTGEPSSVPHPKLSFDKILAAVVAATKVHPRDIMGRSRVRYIKNARWMVIYLIRELKHYSYPEIARLMKLGDHTTVLHAHREFPKQRAEFIEVEEAYQSALTQIQQMMASHQEDELTP